ncbi:MAG: tellurite resistance TerB family protein [Cucumibacter sp.]
MPLSPQHALIYLMVAVSAADRTMTDRELKRIGSTVRNLPIFAGFDEKELPKVAADCAKMLDSAKGLGKVLTAARAALPKGLADTAYALAVEVAAADLFASQEELRLLELIAEKFRLNSLTRAAIEASARARHRTL